MAGIWCDARVCVYQSRKSVNPITLHATQCKPRSILNDQGHTHDVQFRVTSCPYYNTRIVLGLHWVACRMMGLTLNNRGHTHGDVQFRVTSYPCYNTRIVLGLHWVACRMMGLTLNGRGRTCGAV